MTRLEQLHAFITADPDDPFNHYALGLELIRADPAAAPAKFQEVMDRFPSYLPTYYMLCKLLAASSQTEKALDVAARGLALAKETGDKKAWNELNALREEIEW